ncbi:MAG: hypothetical protein ACI8RZ_004278 [Myxococcota bacterium]|jgi:hypothetical protein
MSTEQNKNLVRQSVAGFYNREDPNALHFSGTSTYRIADGKLAECWAIADWQTMLQQLGLVEALS